MTLTPSSVSLPTGTSPYFVTSKDMPDGQEHKAWLALFPLFATGVFYVFPQSIQEWTPAQFFPQCVGYVGLAIWVKYNDGVPKRLGLSRNHLTRGMWWGGMTGLILGIANTLVILLGVPGVGWEIEFLKETPHAHIPTAFMVPWVIVAIALAVELNFRGFLLGRLLFLFQCSQRLGWPWFPRRVMTGLAVALSALAFSFDPFMVATFQHLHWIAVWDGLIWAWIWVSMRNLYAVIVAHAVEVTIVYLCVKTALT